MATAMHNKKSARVFLKEKRIDKEGQKEFFLQCLFRVCFQLSKIRAQILGHLLEGVICILGCVPRALLTKTPELFWRPPGIRQGRGLHSQVCVFVSCSGKFQESAPLYGGIDGGRRRG